MRFRRPPVARPDRGGGRRINGRVFRSAFRRPTGLTAPALSGKADARFGSAPVPRPHSEWRETPRGSRSKAGRPSGSVCLRDCCGTPPFAAAGAFAAARLPPYLLVKCPCGTNKTNRREHNSSLRRSIVCSFVYFTPVSDSKGQNNQLIVFDHTDKPVIAYFVSPVPFPISDQRLALCFGIAAPLQVFRTQAMIICLVYLFSFSSSFRYLSENRTSYVIGVIGVIGPIFVPLHQMSGSFFRFRRMLCMLRLQRQYRIHPRFFQTKRI